MCAAEHFDFKFEGIALLFLFAGLTMHTTILAYMFTLVEEDKITTPLFDPTKVQAASNVEYIQKYVAELLKQAFPHLQEYVALLHVSVSHRISVYGITRVGTNHSG